MKSPSNADRPTLSQQLQTLPAGRIAARLCALVQEHPAVVVTAPPGAGKSTLLPLALMESLPPEGRILMLEPRRLAARAVAERMALLLGEKPGERVGYRVRFESRVSASTRVEVVTEGILTRRLVDDPGLEGVSVVIFDEFHERSLQTDVALALTRAAQSLLRPDLKILLMSATLDAGPLCKALDAPLLSCEGTCYPVDIRYASETLRPEEAAVRTARAVLQMHREESGDILAFLPGEGEIRTAARLLEEALAPTAVCPLYGSLTFPEQRRALSPSAPGARKVVLATPVAETSLTIEGVRVVVDSGLCRQPVFDPRTALERLETVRITEDRADQRAGRAGRLEPGICLRLWTRADASRMEAVRRPEILEADLAPTVLQIAAWGGRTEDLPWLTPPPAAAVAAARTLLERLGALDEKGLVTPHGRALAAVPCHPRMAQMLLHAATPAQKALAADLAALLEECDPLGDTDGAGLDLRIDALRAARRGADRSGRWRRLIQAAAQYRSLCGTDVPLDNGPSDPYEIGALVAAAYPERIACTLPEGNGQFLLAGGEKLAQDASDPLCASSWLAVAAMNARPGGVGRIFLAAPVTAEDLLVHAREREILNWDGRLGKVIARRERRIGVLLLSETPLADVPQDRVIACLCTAARKEGLSMFDFSDEVAGLQRRIAALAAWHPELELPDVQTQAILDRAEEWLPLYAGGARTTAALRKIDLRAVLTGMLSYDQQQALERLAPDHFTLPCGRRARVEYRTGADAPVVRARLEDCFGLAETPRVDGGRLPVLMELLSPGFKPVQLTSDLNNFWKETYFEVRKELRRRYPRHPWPDDPLAVRPAGRT